MKFTAMQVVGRVIPLILLGIAYVMLIRAFKNVRRRPIGYSVDFFMLKSHSDGDQPQY